jgi:uncharacterized protein YdcH (DUF465 family)
MRIPHELGDEFPDQQPLIKRLTKSSYEFGRLAAAYDEVNRHIWRIESEDEPTTDEALEKLKKRRLLLKDDIAAFLTKTRRRTVRSSTLPIEREKRDPGPIWGGWWLWEPPLGAVKEEMVSPRGSEPE